MPDGQRLALAFDATEWFQDAAWANHVSRRHWRRLAARLPIALDAARQLCAVHGAQATFFVCGSTAQRWPELLRQLVAAGHEVASAGHEPLDLDAVPVAGRDEVLAAWAAARRAIEAVTQQRVRGFRSPWPTVVAPWWREHLAAAGYDYEVRADGRVHAFAGGEARVQVVAASELDAEQPQLRGLPRAVQRAHYERLPMATARLEATLRSGACSTIADVLGLAVEPAAVAPISRSAPVIPAPGDRPRLAIVVPLKDEAEGVPSLLLELDALALELGAVAAVEFVFVDDGSVDATAVLLADAVAARRDARLVQHEHNRGVAAAIRTGLLATDAPLVASIDADLSYDPREIARMLPLLAHADVVTASPYHPDGGVKNVPGWRLLLSRTLSAFYRRLLRSDVHTWTACFRLYRRAAVVDLPQLYPGFLGTAELLVRVLRRGGVVVEHPCMLEARLFGVSKLRVLRTIRDHLGLLWQVARGRIS